MGGRDKNDVEKYVRIENVEHYETFKVNADGITPATENGNLEIFLRLDSFYEIATFKQKTLLETFGEIGGLISFLFGPLASILGYIAKV